MGWYAALDLQSWQERNWRLDIALQAGVMFRSGTRTWRFGIEHYTGRPSMSEFFRDNETSTSIGLWLEV